MKKQSFLFEATLKPVHNGLSSKEIARRIRGTDLKLYLESSTAVTVEVEAANQTIAETKIHAVVNRHFKKGDIEVEMISQSDAVMSSDDIQEIVQ